jgi:hypothetical protein
MTKIKFSALELAVTVALTVLGAASAAAGH